MNKKDLIKLCVDATVTPTNFSSVNADGLTIDEAIRKGFAQVLGKEELTEQDIRFTHTRELMFEVLTEIVKSVYKNNVDANEFYTQFADVRYLDEGDSQEFYIEDDGVVVLSEHAGNNWDIDRQKMEGGKSFPVPVKAFAAKVYTEFFYAVTGRVTFASLVEKISEGVTRKINAEIAASFASATSNLPAELGKQGSFVLEDLIEIYNHVEAEAGSAVVIGTRAGLNKVFADANFGSVTQDMKADYHNNGVFYNYRGMTLVQLPNVHKPGTLDFEYDDNTLLVIPNNDDKFIKVVFEGQDLIKEVADNTVNHDMTYEHSFITRFGTAVVIPSIIGKYEIQ